MAPFHPQLRTEATEEGALLARAFRWDARTLRMGMNLTLLTDYGALDLLSYVPGVGAYPEVLAAAVRVPIFGHSLAILDLPGLLRAKQTAGRPKDLAVLPDIEALIRLRGMDRQRDPSPEAGHE